LTQTFIDLGCAPPSNAYLRSDQLDLPETSYPLKVMVCNGCWLVQTLDFSSPDELFGSEYAYFSSFSEGWLSHASEYVANVVERFDLGPNSHVVEVASNDGYLLRYVLERGIPCTGIEPTAGTAAAARARGIETVEAFFGVQLARELAETGMRADLIVANNVLAHVPDINDFVAGFRLLLAPDGVVTFEFPHLMRLVEGKQFDTIYHEHFSYLSFTVVRNICAAHGLTVFDVEELDTHGGSLRVYAQRTHTGVHRRSESVGRMSILEREVGMGSAEYYVGFQATAETITQDFMSFLRDAKERGMRVAAYGAAAKGNTLLNFAGCGPEQIAYVVDRNPSKQGKFMPGSRIPIVQDDVMMRDRPDYVVILPWNLKSELMAQLEPIRRSGCAFVTAVPQLEIVK
jgi:SAM-dependent methyltransferase